jgi:hypothetical protein
MRIRLCTALLIGLLASPALATIVVSFDPPSQSVDIGMGITTVDIVADIPTEDAIIGWGLDLGTTGTSVSFDPVTYPPVIGPLFTPAFAPDGDGLCGLVPPPDTVSGSGILLATVVLTLDDLGTTYLDASYTPGDWADLTEGFMTEFGFADVSFVQGSVTVTPEPASLLLLALVGLLRRR